MGKRRSRSGINAGIDDAVKLARSRLPSGENLTHCQVCDEGIPEARSNAFPGVRVCVACQTELEAEQKGSTSIKRRGSKYSQLK